MSVAEILKTEFCERFVELMRNAMVMSFYKYGYLRDAYPLKVDALASLRKRLELYENTGNTEYLVDVANFAMIEFMAPRHKDAHYAATDDDGSPGRVSTKNKKLDKRDNIEIGTNPASSLAKFRE